ncbi:hypothetical protein [Saccharibacillus kuerlensis]|uniref:DUF3153 domain-containing protein n=1 Tax=Saccharibacillus kuerlensis TaxID=459527 RepID=A0ABQ2L3E3_9BACL|nr:hypothetical protein [Saccharibacillus kuerlensis]GGN98703.1 hypothetical protein GCM10010969_18090 [Saccharibacillus kuerlensis]
MSVTKLQKNKRLYALIVPIVLCLLLSACAQGVVDVTVNTDGTADIRMDAAIDNSALNTLGQGDLFEKIAAGLREQGIDAQAVNKDDQTLLTASKKVELSGSEIPELPDGITLQNRREDGLFSTTYHIVVTANPPQLFPNESSSLTGFIGSRLLGRFINREFDFDFKLNLPIKPDAHNADEISANGRSMTWHLSPTRENRIELSVTVPDVKRIIYTASGALIVIIGIVAFLLLRRKRRQKAQTDTTPS